MIAIVGALEIEISGIIDKLNEKKIVHGVGIDFTRGKLGGKDAVVCKCGVGKVHSAAAASALIQLFNPELVINVGVAGGALPLKQGNIVIAESAVQHDFDTTADGDVKGQVAGFDSPFMRCDESAVKQLKSAADKLGYYAVLGVVATGDLFVSDREKAGEITREFGACAYDMETGAIAQVCAVCGIKYAAVRAISDNGDDCAIKSFYEFAVEAAKRSIEILTEFVENY